MPSAAYVKYELAIEKMLEAGNAGTDSYAVILSNTAPNVATATNAASVTELSTGGGYTAGGNAVTVTTSASTAGVFKLVLTDPATWTGTGGGFTARYAHLYNVTLAQVISYYDYGSAQVVAAGETFVVDLDQAAGVYTAS
jgi:hypothetical protein